MTLIELKQGKYNLYSYILGYFSSKEINILNEFYSKEYKFRH